MLLSSSPQGVAMRDVLEERVTQVEKRVERNDSELVQHFAELMAFLRAQFGEMDRRFERMEGRVTTAEREMRSGFATMTRRFERLEGLLDAFNRSQGGINRGVEARLRAVERRRRRRAGGE
jgi:hypothetical protein